MAGGLEGRLLREKAREQQLRNILMAEQIGRPTAMLEDMGLMEQILGQTQSRELQAQRAPAELESLILRNLGLDQANQRQALELQYLPESLRTGLEGQRLNQQLTRGEIEQQDYLRDTRERDYRDTQDYRQRMLENQQLQMVPSLFQSVADFVNPQELALSYLRRMGLEGEFQERRDPFAGFGAPQQSSSLSPEAQAQLINALQQLQQTNGN